MNTMKPNAQLIAAAQFTPLSSIDLDEIDFIVAQGASKSKAPSQINRIFAVEQLHSEE